MPDKVPMEFSPFMGPDSLRALTHLMKALFNNHTPKSKGFEDTEGSYYEGTVENWGAESLMEARKLAMDKPSLKNILIENTFDYYFNVKYSDFVNTYDQQNMLCAILRKDVLLSNKTYRLKFEDIYTISVPRAKSSSDPNIVKDNFIATSTPPTLIEITNGAVSNEYPLKITDITGGETVYFFHLGVETEDFMGEISGNEMITLPITDSMNGYPMIWMCVNILKTYPSIGFSGNEYGHTGKPFISVGTNGHDTTYAYPFISLTSDDIDLNDVVVKIYPTDNASFTESIYEGDLNYETEISEVHILIYPHGEVDIHTAPMVEFTITHDTDFVHFKLHQARYLYWKFRAPVYGDYDYDGTTYINRVYAYTESNPFIGNLDYSTNPLPVMDVQFDGEFEYPTEYLNSNAYAGAHVDITSDHSDNGVDKKNGVIHNFGDFNGLPPYYSYNIDKVMHRAHIELYATHDQLNNPYQKAMDKPTAGIIVDSGIPQSDYGTLTTDIPVTIKFVTQDLEERRFWWVNTPLSKYNVLSEIVYIDPYHLGNARIFGQENKKKLVYHGNRRFSLSQLGFDPELEYGRTYIISNDPPSYHKNNEDGNKPARTFARICDIPTYYSQITGIPNLAPVFVFDPEYVRTEVNFTLDDITDINNKTLTEHLIHDGSRYIFDNTYTNYTSLANAQYPKFVNLLTYVDLNDSSNVTFEGNMSSTSGYEVDDEFSFYIGGNEIHGKVSDASSGVVTDIKFLNETDGTYGDHPVLDEHMMNFIQFSGAITTYPTNIKTGEGHGLTITLTIDNAYYTSLSPRVDGILSNTYFFYRDEYDVITVREIVDGDIVPAGQVTGEYEFKNSYDTGRVHKVSFLDAFLANNTDNESHVPASSNIRESPDDPPTDVEVWDIFSTKIKKTDYDQYSTHDWSSALNEDRVCYEDTYYVITNKGISDYSMITRFSKNPFVDDNRYSDLKYPNFGDLNLAKYYQKSSVLKYNFDQDDKHQTSVSFYDPNIDEKKTVNQVSHDLNVLESSRKMTLKDIFVKSRFTPENLINDNGELQANVYKYSEYDCSKRDNFIGYLNDMSRDDLVDMIRNFNENADLLKYEDSDYEYSKEMLIDYIVENIVIWEPEDVPYTDAPASIYRKPGIKLFETYGSQVINRHGDLEGKSITGDFVPVINELNPNRKLGLDDVEINPTFIFRLDGINPDNLDGFRMYDGNIDITLDTMLIINYNKYIATMDGETVKWIRIARRNDQ